MRFPHGETVTRLRAVAVVDPYSGESTGLDWTTPDTLVLEGCAFVPGASNENVSPGRDAVVSQPTVYAPSGSDVLAGDRLLVRGKTHDVDGDPAEWSSPFTGWAAGLAVTLKVVDG